MRRKIVCILIPSLEFQKKWGKEIEWLDYGVAVCGCAARDASRIVCENIQPRQIPNGACKNPSASKPMPAIHFSLLAV